MLIENKKMPLLYKLFVFLKTLTGLMWMMLLSDMKEKGINFFIYLFLKENLRL